MRLVPCLAVLILAAGPGLGQSAEDIARLCGTASNLPPAICACLGARAEAELDAAQRDFLMAMLSGDDAAAARLRGGLGAEALIETATFVTEAPVACARG